MLALSRVCVGYLHIILMMKKHIHLLGMIYCKVVSEVEGVSDI